MSKVSRVYSLSEIRALTVVFEKSEVTIRRWIKKNNDILTSEKAKEALSKIKK